MKVPSRPQPALTPIGSIGARPPETEAAGDRPFLLLHGTEDQRLAYEGAVKFADYAESVGVDVTLETFEGADHTEGMLSETMRYRDALVNFFTEHLGDPRP